MGSTAKASNPVYTVFTLQDPKTKEVQYAGVTSQMIRGRISGMIGNAVHRDKMNYRKNPIDDFLLWERTPTYTIHGKTEDYELAYLMKAELLKKFSHTCLNTGNLRGRVPDPSTPFQKEIGKNRLKRELHKYEDGDKMPPNEPGAYKRGARGRFTNG